MLYWLPNAGASAARLYWESVSDMALKVDLPVGVSVSLHDGEVAPREWGERSFSDIIHWREVTRGGHFAAFEQPGLLVEEVRECFRRFHPS